MIRKFSPIDQASTNLFKQYDYEDPSKGLGLITMYKYSITVDTTSVTTVDAVRLTLPGGSPVTYSFTSAATTSTAGRQAIIDAINTQLVALGYDGKIGGYVDGTDFLLFTDFSEVVFVGLKSSGNTFTAGDSIVKGIDN